MWPCDIMAGDCILSRRLVEKPGMQQSSWRSKLRIYANSRENSFIDDDISLKLFSLCIFRSVAVDDDISLKLFSLYAVMSKDSSIDSALIMFTFSFRHRLNGSEMTTDPMKSSLPSTAWCSAGKEEAGSAEPPRIGRSTKRTRHPM